MKRKISAVVRFLLIPIVVLLFSGCADRSGVVLQPRDLFRDTFPADREAAADYDALVCRVDGAEIYGQILIPDRSFGENRPCVLIFHGFAGFGRFDDVGQALCRAGCVVLIPHHRGAWGSQGKYSISNCVRDAAELIRHVKSREFRAKYPIDPKAVFLVGHSMGGNTVLQAAVEVPEVRGIVMLAPCDIGTMFRRTPKEEMRRFMIDNGLGVLRTDGFDAVYDDLARHAAEYAFPKAAGKLKNVGLLLITAEWDRCVSNELPRVFFSAARDNKSVSPRWYRSYPSGHGLMGVRTRVTRDIAGFILAASE